MTELHNYVNYMVASPVELLAIVQLDQGHYLPAKSEKWWARRLEHGEELNTVIHIAMHIHTRRLIGYIATTWLTHNTIKIERLLVGEDFRRIHIGTRMLLRVLADKPPIVTRLVYTVPEADLDSQLFLKAVGFIAKMPLKYDAFPQTETGIGIKFEWNETRDAI